MKTALVYDRVNKWGGAERVLLALNELFPDAPLYTAVYNPKTAPWAKKFPEVIPTFLNKVPYFRDKHELLGTLTPIAFETLDLSGFDLVLSVTSEAAKGVIVRPPTVHICYCLTPTRYLWSYHNFYFKNPPTMLGKIPFFYHVSKPFVWYARYWDKIAAQRPDVYVAISTAVRKRIKKYYGRDSEVIYPPADIKKFKVSNVSKLLKEDYFLYVSRLIPYKMADLAIEAFNELGFPLVIVGKGSEEIKFKSLAKGNIKFVSELTDRQLASYYQKARAFIFPQEEDFGIVAVEAQAAGTPIIAYKAGGALDTVIDPVKAKLTGQAATGVFFDNQDKDSLIGAVKRFNRLKFNSEELVKNAEKFSKEIFKNEIIRLVQDVKE
ncbi:glycosyltransferase [Patescibacteria group bacterium]|nr:glycosyltransferase [Patescibacteria group bacterium]